MVMRGQGRNHIADELLLSLATVKTHLHHAFDKTDTHRQAELVRLLLSRIRYACDIPRQTVPGDEANDHVACQVWESRPSGSTCTDPASCAPGISGISCRPPTYRRRTIHTTPPSDSTPAAISAGHVNTWANHTRRWTLTIRCCACRSLASLSMCFRMPTFSSAKTRPAQP
jgi:hypothetical protein